MFWIGLLVGILIPIAWVCGGLAWALQTTNTTLKEFWELSGMCSYAVSNKPSTVGVYRGDPNEDPDEYEVIELDLE